MTLNDIAHLAGVSKATASRAFSNPSMVNEATRERVLEVARRNNFRPNAMAQAVASRKSGLIGFCLYNKSRPFFGHTFFGPVLDGVTEQAKAMNYHVVLAITDQMQDNFEERFIEDGIEGAILSTFAPEKMVEVFRARKIPVVIVNDELPAKHTGYIIDDNYGGAKKMMAHLIDERGYQSVAFISNRLSHTSNMLRYIGYLDALDERKLPPYRSSALPQYDLLGRVKEFNRTPLAHFGLTEIPRRGSPVILRDLSPQAAYEGVQPLLDCSELPRAIFCTADSIAVGVIKAIHARGLRVPEDIAVCGYDDIDIAILAEPAITTISVNRNGIGRAAMELLRSYIDNPNRPSKTICLENQLVIREST